MNTQTTSLFAVGVDELDSRKSFLQFNEADLHVLKELQPFALSICQSVTREFYDQLFSDEALFHYFEELAKQKKVHLTELRDQLEMNMAEQFVGMFSGLEGEWSKEYFEQALFSKKESEGTLLPPKWYIASSAHLAKIVIPKIAKKFWFRPLFVKKSSEAFLKLMNLNEQMVVEHYTQPFTRIVSEVQLASEHTAGATHKIQEIIAEQSSRLTQHASDVQQVEATVDNLHERFAQIEEMSMHLGDSLEQAISVMGEIRKQVDVLRLALNEQKIASDKAKEVVKQMEGISGEFIASGQQTLDSAMELDKEMGHLRSVVANLH